MLQLALCLCGFLSPSMTGCHRKHVFAILSESSGVNNQIGRWELLMSLYISNESVVTDLLHECQIVSLTHCYEAILSRI